MYKIVLIIWKKGEKKLVSFITHKIQTDSSITKRGITVCVCVVPVFFFLAIDCNSDIW